MKTLDFTVVAGPNGAGKTTLSEYFFQKGIIQTEVKNPDIFDERVIKRFVGEDPNISNDADVRFQAAIDQRKFHLKDAENAIKLEQSFAYESNLSVPFYEDLFKLFKANKYQTTLLFIFLNSFEKSLERANKRYKSKEGIFVFEETVKFNFENGLKYLDKSHSHWDNLYIIDNSLDIDISTKNELTLSPVLMMQKGVIINSSNFITEKIAPLLPQITEKISNSRLAF